MQNRVVILFDQCGVDHVHVKSRIGKMSLQPCIVQQFHEISVEVMVNLCVCKCIISQIALVSPTLILNVKMLKHGRTHALGPHL